MASKTASYAKKKIGSSLPPLPFRPAAPFFALSNYEDPQCPQPTKITSTDLVPDSLPAAPRANSRRAVERRFSTRLKSFLAVGRTRRGITGVVSLQTSSMSDPAHRRVDTIHNYWNVTLKNEFSEFFIKREPPRYKGLEVAQDLVQASMNQTSELMTKILSVVMIFEKSCDISISDMLLHTGNSDLVQALSVSGYFILKIERYFMALDELQNLKQTTEKGGKLRTSQGGLGDLTGIREQNLLC
jgi:hypothetical protein